MRIAFQGEPGAYSEAAALKFSDHADLLPCESFEGVFAAVANGKATHGILPVENSIGGSIHRNYDLLVEHELPIVGEVQLKVDHCLLALPGVTLEDVKVVHSHPQALAQCERFLRNLPGVDIAAVYDTAGGAKLIREEERRHDAAIASIRAAPSSPRLARWSASASCGKRRISSAYSIGSPSPPTRAPPGARTTGTTATYRSGAVRRLSRSSSSQ